MFSTFLISKNVSGAQYVSLEKKLTALKLDKAKDNIITQLIETKSGHVFEWFEQKTAALESLVIPPELTENGFMEAEVAVHGCYEEICVQSAFLERFMRNFVGFSIETKFNETVREKVLLCDQKFCLVHAMLVLTTKTHLNEVPFRLPSLVLQSLQSSKFSKCFAFLQNNSTGS